LRILFVSHFFDPEPGAIRGLPLARQLIKAGDEVEVLTGFPNYPGGKIYAGYRQRPWLRETMHGVPVLRVPLYPSHDCSPLRRALSYGSFAVSATLLGIPRVRQADVGFVYHPPPTVGLPAVVLQTLRRIPFVYHIADMWPESVVESGMVKSRRLVGSLISAWCKFVYARASLITVLSPGFKRLLIERGVPESKIQVVFNWAEDEVFRPVSRNQELAETLGLGHSFNVIYAGNLGGFQDVETIVRAAVLVKHSPSVKIVIVGTGQKEREVKAVAAQLGADNVVFVGRRHYWEMPQICALADVLVIHLKDYPFFSTTIPSKTQVSLACGRPILMAVRGDAAEVVRKAGAGLICPPEDPVRMAEAIIRFLEMPKDQREQMGESGRRYYLREMSLDHGAQQMRALFEQVAAERVVGPEAHVAQ
jgi:colanic acid biosynthesis glycosyl transferase WcaI